MKPRRNKSNNAIQSRSHLRWVEYYNKIVDGGGGGGGDDDGDGDDGGSGGDVDGCGAGAGVW